jgi:hypothetical protein
MLFLRASKGSDKEIWSNRERISDTDLGAHGKCQRTRKGDERKNRPLVF